MRSLIAVMLFALLAHLLGPARPTQRTPAAIVELPKPRSVILNERVVGKQIPAPVLQDHRAHVSKVREAVAAELKKHPPEAQNWETLPREQFLDEVDSWASGLIAIMDELSAQEKVAVVQQIAPATKFDYRGYFAYRVLAQYGQGHEPLPILKSKDPIEQTLAYGALDRYGVELYRQTDVVLKDDRLIQLQIDAIKSSMVP